MQTDENTMRAAADSVFFFMQRFLAEQNEANRDDLVRVMRHYSTQGYRIHLKREGVIVTRQAQLAHNTSILVTNTSSDKGVTCA